MKEDNFWTMGEKKNEVGRDGVIAAEGARGDARVLGCVSELPAEAKQQLAGLVFVRR